jgi:hypothetical protein
VGDGQAHHRATCGRRGEPIWISKRFKFDSKVVLRLLSEDQVGWVRVIAENGLQHIGDLYSVDGTMHPASHLYATFLPGALQEPAATSVVELPLKVATLRVGRMTSPRQVVVEQTRTQWGIKWFIPSRRVCLRGPSGLNIVRSESQEASLPPNLCPISDCRQEN